MSVSQLNELLDEAVQRSQQLADRAGEAEDAAKTVEERIRTLGETIEQRSTDAHALFQDALAKLKEAEHRIEGSSDKSRTELHGIETHVEELRGKLTALVTAVKAASDELQQKKGTIESDMTDQVHQTEGHFQEATTKLEGLAGSVDERAGAAAKAIEALHTAVEDVQQGLAQARQRFAQELSDLATHIGTQVHTYVQSVSTALDQACSALVDSSNKVVEAHNGAVEALRAQFIDEAPKGFDDALAQIKEVLGNLARLCEGHEQTTQQKASAILTQVQEAQRLGESLNNVLTLASRLA